MRTDVNGMGSVDSAAGGAASGRVAARSGATAEDRAEAAAAFGRVGLASLGVSAEGVERARLRLLGVSAQVFHRLDRREADRRSAVGQPPILRIGALEALMGLPMGAAVPAESLTERERCLLRTAPPDSFHRVLGGVTRTAAVPLRVELIVATGSTWRSALARAGRFAPFTARAALADRPPDDEFSAAAEADYHGIALAVRDGRTARVLTSPEPFRPRRHSAVKWHFAEKVLAALQAPGL